jgi:hypothetical protein
MKTELDKMIEEMKAIVKSMEYDNFVEHAITQQDIENHHKAWKKITQGEVK